MVLDPELKKCFLRSYVREVRANYMGMVLVEHDSTCRPRAFESVVFVLVYTMHVTVWVDVDTVQPLNVFRYLISAYVPKS